jgi:Ser/Thr protein kinase RdoA (MazF antagonist)
MLEQSDIAHYLLSLGLVKPRAVVEGDLTVRDMSRRNSVFLAGTRGGPTYVVKQGVESSGETLAHEADVLRALAGDGELAVQVPAVVHEEPEAARLVLRTPSGARDWCDHRGRFPRVTARALGRFLATLHQLPPDYVGSPPGADRMWGLSLPEPSHELLLDLSTAAQDLVARVQASRALCARLDELRDSGSHDALVHGDMRWDNCLAVAAPHSQRRTRVLLVDWELAGGGAAGFDVGTVLAEYLRVWIGSIPIVDPREPALLIGRARHPLEEMRPAVQSFWSAYAAASPLRPTLRRVIELAAVRLLQTAVEHARAQPSLTSPVVNLVQLADNLLRDPEGAALSLLALRE